MLDLVDYFINNVALLASCLVELVVIAWLLKVSDIRSYVNSISEFSIGKWFEICIRFLSPAMLAVILGTNLVNTFNDGYGGYEASDLLMLGWGLVAAMFVVAVIINVSSKPQLQQEAKL